MSKKKTTGFVAGAAGIALLMGGATFALWSDSADAGGGTITAGNLQVDVLNPTWTDVSEDREEDRDIDLGKYRIVPGDTIRGSFPIDVALDGDNLTAELELVPGDRVSGDLFPVLAENFRYTVTGPQGRESSGTDNLMRVHLDSRDVPSELDGEHPDVIVDVFFTFSGDISGRDLMEAKAHLDGAGIQLKQVREG